MKKHKVITLDLTDCKYLGEIHERIRTAFNFPEWYGANWDAFWDLLWSECDADEVIVKGTKTLPDEFKLDIEKMKKILLRMQNEQDKFSRLYNDVNPFIFKILD